VNAIDPTATIGVRTVIWHFAVILADVTIGDDCSIGSHCEVGRGSQIGDGSRLSYGVFLPPNSVVGQRVFLGPGVIATDDKFPCVRSVEHPRYDAQPPRIDDDASIGAGAILLPGVHIGVGAMIGAGAIVTHDVAPGVIVKGEPARAYLRRVS
jgi:acetyltransferase-like isoleucine patch superfamily enzyme